MFKKRSGGTSSSRRRTEEEQACEDIEFIQRGASHETLLPAHQGPGVTIENDEDLELILASDSERSIIEIPPTIDVEAGNELREASKRSYASFKTQLAGERARLEQMLVFEPEILRLKDELDNVKQTVKLVNAVFRIGEGNIGEVEKLVMEIAERLPDDDIRAKIDLLQELAKAKTSVHSKT